MSINTFFNNITLSEWNVEITNSLLPNIIILFVYLALGTCGNVFVLMVYVLQMTKASDERYFIPILAFFDMIATLYLGVHYIVQCFYQTTFSNNILCKTLVFFVANTTYYSVFILLIIAIQRYMKLCMLQKPSMSITLRKMALFLAILLSILFALPLPFIYGTIKYQSTEYGITGMRCGRLKEEKDVIMTLYSIGFGMYVFVLVTTLIIIYIKILKTVFHNLKKHKSDTTCSKKEIKKTDEDENRSDISCKEIEVSITSTKAAKQAIVPEATSDSVGQHVSKSPVANTVEAALSGKRRTRNEITRKVTIMFFIITTVFVLCYIPKVTILCLEGIYEDFWENLSSSLRPGVTFLYHIFIINNIVNPLIDAFMDIEFRDNAVILLKRMFNSCIK